MAGRTALLLIDVQRNMLEPPTAVSEAAELLPRLERLLASARRAEAVVVMVQNDGGEGDPDQPGTPGWHIHPALAPSPGEPVINKRTPDAFEGTTLHEVLVLLDVKRVVVAGMQSELCVSATTRRAADLGYAVTLAGDAHGTFDLEGVPAGALARRVNTDLGEVATVMESETITW